MFGLMQHFPIRKGATAPTPEILHRHADRVPDEGRTRDKADTDDSLDLRGIVGRFLAGTEDEPRHSIAGIFDTAKFGNVDVFDGHGLGKHFYNVWHGNVSFRHGLSGLLYRRLPRHHVPLPTANHVEGASRLSTALGKGTPNAGRAG